MLLIEDTLFCNDIITYKIIMEESTKQLIFIFMVGHLGFLLCVNYILISFN